MNTNVKGPVQTGPCASAVATLGADDDVNTGKGLELTLNLAPVKGLNQTKRLKGRRSSHLIVLNYIFSFLATHLAPK